LLPPPFPDFCTGGPGTGVCVFISLPFRQLRRPRGITAFQYCCHTGTWVPPAWSHGPPPCLPPPVFPPGHTTHPDQPQGGWPCVPGAMPAPPPPCSAISPPSGIHSPHASVASLAVRSGTPMPQSMPTCEPGRRFLLQAVPPPRVLHTAPWPSGPPRQGPLRSLRSWVSVVLRFGPCDSAPALVSLCAYASCLSSLSGLHLLSPLPLPHLPEGLVQRTRL